MVMFVADNNEESVLHSHARVLLSGCCLCYRRIYR